MYPQELAEIPYEPYQMTPAKAGQYLADVNILQDLRRQMSGFHDPTEQKDLLAREAQVVERITRDNEELTSRKRMREEAALRHEKEMVEIRNARLDKILAAGGKTAIYCDTFEPNAPFEGAVFCVSSETELISLIREYA